MKADARKTSEYEKSLAHIVAATTTGMFRVLEAVLKTVFNILTALSR